MVASVAPARRRGAVILALGVLASIYQSGKAEQPPAPADLQQILQRLDNLEKRNEALEKRNEELEKKLQQQPAQPLGPATDEGKAEAVDGPTVKQLVPTIQTGLER